jgi:hypothetical protein
VSEWWNGLSENGFARMKTKSKAMRHITVARDDRTKKYRVRVGDFDSSFTSREIAIHIASIEHRMRHAA